MNNFIVPWQLFVHLQELPIIAKDIYTMNRIKTYVFDINIYPYTLDINATSIIEAKKKVRNMGYHKAYFVKIKPYATD